MNVFLSYLSLAVPFLLMFVLGLLVPALLVLSYSRFGVGTVLIVFAFMVDTMTLGGGGVSIGINIFYPDMVFVLIAVVTCLRLVFVADYPHCNRAWLGFCALVCVSLATGLVAYGSTAGVQARSYFYFIVAGTYAMTFEMTTARLRFVFNALASTAYLLIVLAVYRWIVYYTPIPSLLPASGTFNIDGAIRVIYSQHALVIAQVLVAGFFFVSAARGFSLARVTAPLLLSMVLVLQHRSVWLSAMVGFFVRFLLGRSKTGSPLGQLCIVVGVVALTALPMVFSQKLSGVTEQVEASASHALSGQGTVSERMDSWREIVKNWYGAGVRSIVIGQSFGSDNTRYVRDSEGLLRKIDYIAHNLYVQTLFNTGLLGLLTFLAANVYVMLGLYRICRDGRGGAETETLLVLLAMQLAYYVPYGVDFLQSLLFGVALAYVAGRNAGVGVPVAAGVRRRATA